MDEPGAQPFSYLHTFFCEELLCRIMKDGQAVEASLLAMLEETSCYNPSPFQNNIGPLTIGPGCLHLPQLQKLNISFSLFHNQSFTFTPDLMVDLRIFSWWEINVADVVQFVQLCPNLQILGFCPSGAVSVNNTSQQLPLVYLPKLRHLETSTKLIGAHAEICRDPKDRWKTWIWHKWMTSLT